MNFAIAALHGTRSEIDVYRTEKLKSLGIEVIRFENAEVVVNPDFVLRAIGEAVDLLQRETES